MVSRVATAAASSRAKSPGGVERVGRRNDRAPVIVCCATAGNGKAVVQSMNAVAATTTGRGMITRLLLFLCQRERLPGDRQRSRAVVAGVVRRRREMHRDVSA